MGNWADVDIPYNKGERANVGILAAAATRIGYIPFEEYFAEKGRGKSRRKGRADFWLAKKNSKESYDLEAKYVELSFCSKRLADTINRHLDLAAEDAIDIRYKSDRTIGIVFVSPYRAVRKDFSPDLFWNQLSDLKQYNGNFCALHICDPKIWTQTYNKDRPGIALVGRYI